MSLYRVETRSSTVFLSGILRLNIIDKEKYENSRKFIYASILAISSYM
jgi:hypothetical protein